MTQQRSNDDIREDLTTYASSEIWTEAYLHATHRLARDVAPLLARAERAEAQVQRVRAVHVPYDCTAAGEEGHETCGEREWCYSCPEELGWHCPTVAALDSAE